MDVAISEPAIATLVSRFYAKARKDPMIGPLFEQAVEDWDEHLAKLSDFWSSVMLTTGRYKGNPMAAHMRQPIEPEFFDRWLDLWRETTGEVFGVYHTPILGLAANPGAAHLNYLQDDDVMELIACGVQGSQIKRCGHWGY